MQSHVDDANRVNNWFGRVSVKKGLVEDNVRNINTCEQENGRTDDSSVP